MELNRAVLADFDVARVSSGGTTTGGAPGTEPFMAPEVANRNPVSPKADMFSFGVTMVCVLMAEIWDTRMPKTTMEVLEIFHREQDGSALSKHLLEEPLRSSEALVGSSGPVIEAIECEQLFDVVSQLLNVDPIKRPSANQVLDHPFFEKIKLVEAPLAPTTPPRLLGDGACLVYTVTHAGEQASNAGMTWEQIHFNEAAVQFHLMIGAQRNVRVQEVLVIVNEALRVQFESKREALDAAGKPTHEIWVFHGTGSQANVDAIITGGFRVPPAGEETNGARYGQGENIHILTLMN